MNRIKNRKIFFLIILILSQTYLIFSNTISELIRNKKWDSIEQYFADDSYLILKKKLDNYLRIKLFNIKSGSMEYHVKFSDHGEIGTIYFKKDKEKFCCLEFRENFTNLALIDKFYKIQIKNKTIQIADAQITFLDGTFYISDTIKRLLIYKGNYSMNVFPKDIEEQKTLKSIYKKSTFSISRKKGVFIFPFDLINKLFEKNKKRDENISINEKNFIHEQLIYL